MQDTDPGLFWKAYLHPVWMEELGLLGIYDHISVPTRYTGYRSDHTEYSVRNCMPWIL